LWHGLPTVPRYGRPSVGQVAWSGDHATTCYHATTWA